ncbi:MAG TPA: hypothetical protein VF937_00435 [Chloroflexota bacterium]
MTRDHARIMVSGMIAAQPGQGGATWAVLQYLLGLRRLGHEVSFVEVLRPSDLSPDGGPFEQTINVRYFERTMRDFGFADRSALLLKNSRLSAGLPYARAQAFARQTDVLINLSGALADADLLQSIPVRVYVDLDPGFTQAWHAQGIDVRLEGHTHYATVGLGLGQPECSVPGCDREWLTTLQPVALEYWPTCRAVISRGFTTVANWRGYGSIEHNGVFYGQKAHSVREYIDLPTLTREDFLLALAIHADERKDIAALRANGWITVDPRDVASDPGAYQRFIQGSRAELGIAKQGYVAARTGWFSDRSICYLASGRPVLAQDTGFSRFLPTGEGLLAFSTTQEALAGIDTLNADYARHARAARSIAEEYFDSDIVLARLMRLLRAG